MKKCPNCEEKMIIVQREEHKISGLLRILLLIIFFPLSLLILLDNSNRTIKKDFFYCPNCNYSEEIKINLNKNNKKENVNNKKSYFWLYILIVVILSFIVGILLYFLVKRK